MATTPKNEGPISRLPIELCLQIASKFNLNRWYERRQLLRYALVSRKFAAAAQDTLFRDIPTLQNHKASCFLRTLLDRPDLALKVRSLTFVRFGDSFEKIYGAERLQQKVRENLIALGLNKGEVWDEFVAGRVEMAYGLLLFSILKRLEILDLLSIDQLNPPLLGAIHEAFSTSGLRNIRELSLDMENVRLLAFTYPNLTTLKIRRMFTGLKAHIPSALGGSHVKEMEIQIAVLPADPTFEGYTFNIIRLISAMKANSITHFTYKFSPIGRVNLNDSDIGSIIYDIDQLLGPINKMASVLQDLTLEFGTTNTGIISSTMHHSRGVKTLRQLVCLKRLRIPQDFLFRPGEDVPIDMLLPTTLEALEIHYPTEDILSWLRELENSNSSFPNMKRVVLHTRRKYLGKSSEYFILHEDPVWEALDKCGISCFIHDEDKDRDVVRPSAWTRLNGSSRDDQALGLCLKCNDRCGNTHYYADQQDIVQWKLWVQFRRTPPPSFYNHTRIDIEKQVEQKKVFGKSSQSWRTTIFNRRKKSKRAT